MLQNSYKMLYDLLESKIVYPPKKNPLKLNILPDEREQTTRKDHSFLLEKILEF